MKKIVSNFNFLIALLFVIPVFGQNEASKDLDVLIGLPLEEAHAKLNEMGFEIAHSSLFNSNQLWYNETKNECIAFSFSKGDNHTVETIQAGKEKKCIQGVKAARKVWASYIDGSSGVSSAGIDSERGKLSQEGYAVSYWIKDASPGKTMEVWYNEPKQLCKSIIWDTAGKNNVKVIDRDPRLGKNPAPIYTTNLQ